MSINHQPTGFDYHLSDSYRLTSYFNGLAYVLVNLKLSRSVTVQGDSAAVFICELNKLTSNTAQRAALSFDDALAWLWAEYEDVADEVAA